MSRQDLYVWDCEESWPKRIEESFYSTSTKVLQIATPTDVALALNIEGSNVFEDPHRFIMEFFQLFFNMVTEKMKF